jgi:hypothetical protein
VPGTVVLRGTSGGVRATGATTVLLASTYPSNATSSGECDMLSWCRMQVADIESACSDIAWEE